MERFATPLRRRPLSDARSCRTSLPRVRKRTGGTQLRWNAPHAEAVNTAKRLVYGRARALLWRALIPIRPALSSQTRNRVYSFRPNHLSEMNLIDGARFPCTVVVVVEPPGTTADAVDGVVESPPEV